MPLDSDSERPAAASQREVDLLREDVRRMDSEGTRGTSSAVALMGQQIAAMQTQLGKLSTEMDTKFEAHAKVHRQEARARVISRRWVIGTALAGGSLLVTTLGLVIEIASRVH